MTPLSLVTLTICALVGVGAGALLNGILLASGQFPVLITPFLGLLSIVIAGALYRFGRKVRDLRDGEDTTMHPVVALRVILFARASALVCASLAGLCVGIILTDLGRLDASAVWESAWGAGVAALGLLVWMSVGIVVEKWGQRHDDDPPATPQPPKTKAPST